MKYFTPERYTALQDLSTDAAMNAADAAWEEAVQRYDAYYRSVESQLPRGMKEIQSGYYLHDAGVSNMGRQGDHFLIVLQLDTPPHDLLVFEYDLTGEPFIDEQALPEPLRSRGPVEWLHDEVELVSTDPPHCTHSILLSNGWEVRLPVREVRVRQLSPVMPPRVIRSAATDHPSPFSHPPA